MKTLLAAEEAHNRLLFRSLLTTLKPLMRAGLPEAAVSGTVEQVSEA